MRNYIINMSFVSPLLNTHKNSIIMVFNVIHLSSVKINSPRTNKLSVVKLILLVAENTFTKISSKPHVK